MRKRSMIENGVGRPVHLLRPRSGVAFVRKHQRAKIRLLKLVARVAWLCAALGWGLVVALVAFS